MQNTHNMTKLDNPLTNSQNKENDMLMQLWVDDTGAIISVEWLMLVSLGVFGVTPGVIALRNSMNNAYENMANNLTDMVNVELSKNVKHINNTNVVNNNNYQTVNVILDYKP